MGMGRRPVPTPRKTGRRTVPALRETGRRPMPIPRNAPSADAHLAGTRRQPMPTLRERALDRRQPARKHPQPVPPLETDRRPMPTPRKRAIDPYRPTPKRTADRRQPVRKRPRPAAFPAATASVASRLSDLLGTRQRAGSPRPAHPTSPPGCRPVWRAPASPKRWAVTEAGRWAANSTRAREL